MSVFFAEFPETQRCQATPRRAGCQSQPLRPPARPRWHSGDRPTWVSLHHHGQTGPAVPSHQGERGPTRNPRIRGPRRTEPPPFPPSVCADHQHHCEERRGLAGRAALPGQPAQTSVGQRGLPGKASQRQHVRHQLEGAQAASILSAKLLQVCGLLQNKIASSRKNFESGN